MDEFDQFPDLMGTPPLVEPLPMGLPQSPAQPQQAQPAQKNQWGELAKMLPLLAAAGAKGGRVGIAAFLQGMQQAQARRQQQQQVASRDERQARIDQQNTDWRNQDLMLRSSQQEMTRQNAAATRQAQIRRDFAGAVKNLEETGDMAALPELVRFYAASGDVPAPELERFAMTTVSPSKLQQTQAQKKIDKLRADFGTKWMEEGAKFTHQIGGETVPFAEVLRRAGMAPDPNAPQAKPASGILPDVPLDRQHAMALAAGNTALAKTIEQSIAAQDASRRDPADPVLSELRELRLQQARAGQNATALPPATQRRVDAKTRAFDQQPVVKRIQTMAEAVQFAEGLDINTKNPNDDQALIYAYAKAMDPDSVVREGEYATVQRYSQSWAEQFGFSAARIFSNTPFLTPQARQNMKATIRAKFGAARPQYDNLRRNYTRQINQITQGADGDTYLIDYAAGFPEDPNAKQQPGRVVTPSQPATGRGAPPPNPYRHNAAGY